MLNDIGQAVSNFEIQATWHYHNGTKHPSGRLLNPLHRFDPGLQPLLFKIYSNLPPTSLPLDTAGSLPALEAISGEAPTDASAPALDLPTLARLLYFSAGITKYLEY